MDLGMLGIVTGPMLITMYLKNAYDEVMAAAEASKNQEHDVVLGTINSFDYTGAQSPLNAPDKVPYQELIDVDTVSNIITSYEKGIRNAYDEIAEYINALKTNNLSGENLTLSDGTQPIVDVLDQFITFVNAQAVIANVSPGIIGIATTRRTAEEAAVKQLFSRRAEYLNDEIKKKEKAISSKREEKENVAKNLALTLISPAAAGARQAVLTGQIYALNQEIIGHNNEITALGQASISLSKGVSV